MILTLIDGGIKEIYTDSDFSSGCETCDYGSSYVNKIDIEMATGVIRVRASQMYDYPMSDGYLMQLMLPNYDQIKEMTEQGFFEWLKASLDSEFGNTIDSCYFYRD